MKDDILVKEAIYELHAIPNYEALKRYLQLQRPALPNYKWQEDNTAEWKYQSAKQEGFDLLLTLLKIGVSDD